MGWSSKIPALVSRLEQADRMGLIAAQQVVVNQVKRDLRGGYTSGDFVTGASSNAVTRSEPERTADGHVGRVGTNLLYNLFWELGHRNLFTGRFERVEIWVPALFATRDQQIDAYRRVMLRTLGGDSGSVGVSATVTPRQPVGAANVPSATT